MDPEQERVSNLPQPHQCGVMMLYFCFNINICQLFNIKPCDVAQANMMRLQSTSSSILEVLEPTKRCLFIEPR